MNFHAVRAQIHGRIKKGILDGYPSSALPWLPEDPSDILSIFPFLADRVFEPLQRIYNVLYNFGKFYKAALELQPNNFSTNVISNGTKFIR
jgi:hypothetical protein